MTHKPLILGADPGSNGGFALLYDDGAAEVRKMPETDVDLLDACRELAGTWWPSKPLVVVEQVQPGGLCAGKAGKMGAKSAFTFGGNVRALNVALLAAGFSLRRVTAAKWQADLGIHAKGDKTLLKARAQEMFPRLMRDAKVTLWNADALLIAEWGRRTMHRENGGES